MFLAEFRCVGLIDDFSKTVYIHGKISSFNAFI